MSQCMLALRIVEVFLEGMPIPAKTLFFKFYLFIYLFIYGCVGSSLLRAGFLQLRWAGATLRCGARASHHSGFSCCGARPLGAWAQ